MLRPKPAAFLFFGSIFLKHFISSRTEKQARVEKLCNLECGLMDIIQAANRYNPYCA
jgi:hypothetical protein